MEMIRVAHGDVGGEVGGEGQDLADDVHGPVGPAAVPLDRFEDVAPALGDQGVLDALAVTADIPAGQPPVAVTQPGQRLHIGRLVRPMERAQAQVQDHRGLPRGLPGTTS